MKRYTINYINIFIEVAQDFPVSRSQISAEKKERH
ncbi:hypothetical protein SAMN05880574_101127 [Chryseobacterium sp. RU37D]|nr:hypothetical protein SAMN05880574_101127 [Chryseobacterium sp. RU37D]